MAVSQDGPDSYRPVSSPGSDARSSCYSERDGCSAINKDVGKMTTTTPSGTSDHDVHHLISFELPAKVEFGSGRVGILERVIEESELKRAAFVMDPGRRRSGAFDAIVSRLELRGVEVLLFDRVRSNPTLQTVARCTRSLRRFGPDVVVGIGGGSSLDTAKAAAACIANRTENALDLLDSDKACRRSVPTILIPTTAGTGTEVNYWAVITDQENREKLSIGAPQMAPYMAIVDPELTLSLPRKETLWTGLDALTHALEAFVSVLSNRLSDLLALEAVKLVLEGLGRAVDHGDDLEAREHMALASLLAGAAMQHVGLGLIHAMSHQVSGLYDAPHGLTNAKLLTTVFAFNLPEIPQEKRAILDSLGGKSFQDALMEISGGHGLADDVITIRRRDLALMSKRARENVNTRTNPREPSLEEVRALYHQAFVVE